MNIVTNPNLIVLQALLMAPLHQGTGKWLVFVPEEKANYLAVSKNNFPKILSVLLFFSNRNKTVSDLLEAGIDVDPKEIDNLLERKLLLTSPNNDISRHNKSKFLQLYQIANYNYPFNNYLNDNWADLDYLQMEEYKKRAPRPAHSTASSEEGWPLIPIDRNEIDDSYITRCAGSTFIKKISLILYLTFGEMERVYRNDGTYWVRKTSPSGGARHPTEGYLYLPHAIDNIPPGLYLYDFERHMLVKMPIDILDHQYRQSISNAQFSILIKSHVERAMWRYREIRALRPIIIDAGHIVETLLQLLTRFEFNTTLLYGAEKSMTNLSWVQDPTLATIKVNTNGSICSDEINRDETELEIIDSVQTNPTTHFYFQDGKLIAQTLWPKREQVVVDEKEFMLLTHCLFSRRDDRITTFDYLNAEYQVGSDKLQVLSNKMILLRKTAAHEMFKKIFIWAQHNWYLSFLALLAMTDGCVEHEKIPAAKEPVFDITTFDLIPALLKRKTTRFFGDQEKIKKNDLLTILSFAASVFDQKTIDNTTIYVAVFTVEDLAPVLYEFVHNDKSFRSLGLILDRKNVKEMTTGQIAAGAGAVSVWCSIKNDYSQGINYLTSLLLLGMFGQRIFISATHLGLGVFSTPALCDDKTQQALNFADPIDTTSYSFTIGYRKQT